MILFPSELQDWLDEGRDLTILDIRMKEHRELMSILGLETRVVAEEDIPLQNSTGDPVILFCQFGINTERLIRDHQLENSYSLLGGVLAWNEFRKNKRDYSRYARQMILPEIGPEGQTRLLNSKVTVVGLGGLGCPVTQYLTGAGIGFLHLIDGDRVEASNLQRQPLYHDRDVGQRKVEAACRHLKDMNPHITIHTTDTYLTEKTASDLIAGSDVVVDATDSLDARYWIDSISREMGLPMIYGALYRYEGQVAVLNHNGGPGYRDLFPVRQADTETCEDAGVLGMMPGIIGNIQALETMKILLDIRPNLSGKLLLYDGLNHSIDLIQIPVSDKNIPNGTV